MRRTVPRPIARCAWRGAALGGEALGRLVEVTGHDGVPQPYVWKIVLKDGANASREIDVADGKIVAQRTVPRPPEVSGLVKLQALNLDSGGAFAAADAQSRKVRVRFDSINYALRADSSGQPVWTMDLFNKDGASVGTMRLTATDGTIASIDGRLAEGPGRPGEPLTARQRRGCTLAHRFHHDDRRDHHRAANRPAIARVHPASACPRCGNRSTARSGRQRRRRVFHPCRPDARPYPGQGRAQHRYRS